MPAFVKTPRFIISTIFLIWLISVIWKNHNEPPVYVFYAPFLSVQVRLVWVLVCCRDFRRRSCARHPIHVDSSRLEECLFVGRRMRIE